MIILKVIVAGSRNYYNKELIYSKLDNIICEYDNIEIVQGGATGVDSIAKQYAKDRGLPCKEFPAIWDLYGLSAGAIRNNEMAKYSDVLIAFYSGTAGTRNMIKAAKSKGLKVHIVEV